MHVPISKLREDDLRTLRDAQYCQIKGF